MPIRLRLILSYLVMLIVPVILTVVISILAAHHFSEDFLRTYEGEEKGNPVRKVFVEGNKLFAEIKLVALENPSLLEDPNYLAEMEEKLKTYNGGLIVRKSGELIYSTRNLKELNTDRLPEFGKFIQDKPQGHGKKFVVNQHDFYFADQSEGTLFWVIDTKPLKKVMNNFLITVTVGVLIILALTNGALTYLVAGSIIKPLNKLKDSAEKIREGDLDFELETDTKDEIGEVQQAFEEMRKQLKQSLEKQIQYENNRKELISHISHDLRTPITTIKGYIEGIKDGVADTPEKVKRYLDTIHAKTYDLDKLIDELFLYSKLDLHKYPINLQIVDIVHYLADITEEVAFDLEKDRIELSLGNKTKIPIYVFADPQNLKRVLVNIIQNSVKYMDKEEGKIRINVVLREEEAIIQVKDNGRGIEQEVLPHIFDRFYRADPARNPSTGGSGLGLAIAKRIIEEHGGKMWAESEVGVGTSIYFSLKLSDLEEERGVGNEQNPNY